MKSKPLQVNSGVILTPSHLQRDQAVKWRKTPKEEALALVILSKEKISSEISQLREVWDLLHQSRRACAQRLSKLPQFLSDTAEPLVKSAYKYLLFLLTSHSRS